MKTKIPNHIILVCTQNFNGYGVLRSLAKCGIRPTIITNHNKRNPVVALSRHKGGVIYYTGIEDIPALLLKRCVNNSVKPIVICCDDALQSVVDRNLDELSKYFILANSGQKQGEITRLMDKKEQMRIASECGVTVPMTWQCDKGTAVPSDIVYPCIVKAQVSIHGSKEEMQICRNDAELTECLTKAGHLVQQFIEKDYEVIMYGTSVGNGNYYMPGVTRKVRQYPDDNGMSSFCVLESFDKHPQLDKSALVRFLKALRYTGMFSIEMAVKDGKYYLLEINLRNDGKQYFSTAAKANLPLLYIQSCIGLPVSLPNPKYPTYAMGELTDFRQIKRLPQFSFYDWVRDLMRTDSFFILNFSDPLPGLSDCRYFLRFKFRGLLKRLGFKVN